MATLFPAQKQTMDSPTGADNLDSPDHATNFNRVADTSEAIQDVIGTTLGTNVLKNFTAGDHAARVSNTSVIQETWSGGTIDTSVLKTPKVNVINEETGGLGVNVDGVVHKDSDVIINNNKSYQAKQAGGSAKDLIKLGTDDILRLSQIKVQENTTNSTVEDVMIQTGWGILDGAATATITTTVTLATPIDEDETFSIIVGALGLIVGTATKISHFQTDNTRMLLQAHIEVSGSNIIGFAVIARRNDDSNFDAGTDYGFSWTVMGRKV